MPGMDGLQTFTALMQNPQSRQIPVVFTTAKVQSHEIQHYLELGAADVISKPFNAMTLADNVQTILSLSYD